MSTTLAFGSLQEELAYYKAQYEHLEAELQDFQQSSRELEAELEKDVEASEKRERDLRDKVDAIGFQTDEWKNKYNQSRTEAIAAQSTLQKEVTTLRDANRKMQMKFRDMEVANDEYEIQARNTTVSLDDLESKYNQTLERNVLLQEEMKVGEEEREMLRIESQRLKDELSDLKVENEIVTQRLRTAEGMNERRTRRVSQLTEHKAKRLSSANSDKSGVTASTATTKSRTTARSGMTMSEPHTPPSPPVSENPTHHKAHQLRTTPSKLCMSLRDDTPRPEHAMQKKMHTRPSFGTRRGKPVMVRDDIGTAAAGNEGIPRSNSLYHIRGLREKMQNLETRLQSAKSRLQPPPHTPPRGNSPEPAADMSMPQTVTMRKSSAKRRSILPVNTAVPALTPRTFDPSRSTIASHSPRPPVPPKDTPSRRVSTLHSRQISMDSVDQAQPALQEQTPQPYRSQSRMSSTPSRPPSSFTLRFAPSSSTDTNHSTLPETGTLRGSTRKSINVDAAKPTSSMGASGRPSIGAGTLPPGNLAGTSGTTRRRSNIVRPGLRNMRPPDRPDLAAS